MKWDVEKLRLVKLENVKLMEDFDVLNLIVQKVESEKVENVFNTEEVENAVKLVVQIKQTEKVKNVFDMGEV